jgi:hypothetical protein
MTDKQPTFAERRARMTEIANHLFDFADELHSEAERMAAVEKRFADRRSAGNAKADR